MAQRSFYSLVDITRPISTTCTASTNIDEFCGAPVPSDSPVSMCGKHLMRAFRFCEGLLDKALERRYSRSDVFNHPHLADERRDSIQRSYVVYYARIYGKIKIGTTGCRIEKRMAEIKADALLATEPGHYEIERHRHAQFDHLKIRLPNRRSELFEPGPDLLEHIDRLAAEAATLL